MSKTKILFIFSYYNPPNNIIKLNDDIFIVKFIWVNQKDITTLLPDKLINWPDVIVADEKLLDRSFSKQKVITYSAFQRKYHKFISAILPLKQEENLRVAFFPSNDTHVKLFLPLLRFLSGYIFLVPREKEEGAKKLLEKYKIGWQTYSKKRLYNFKPDTLVLGNDWGLEEKLAIAEARRNNIPTICIQEGPLDFTLDETHRMGWADFAFIQGPIMTKYLHRSLYFITGNPRFDKLSESNKEGGNKVMINLNFTYGIEEKAKDYWLQDVVSACRSVNLPFFISQHPRDKSQFNNLPVEKSNAEVIYKHLQKSTILISRFSTLIYEALLSGRQVVYYNPHKEKMRLFNEDKSEGVYKAYNKDELKNLLSRIKNGEDNRVIKERFIRFHCISADGKSSERCFHALKIISSFYKSKLSTDYYKKNFIYLKIKCLVAPFVRPFFRAFRNFTKNRKRLLDEKKIIKKQ
ncbi:hypothetical protein AMJ49_04225 [Parcubacteria bacterium DG_74_2]|nr:MAG: hypothetical protein AMJ49_04225 [Parcubacteria bacterium DG_74_2]